MLVDINSLFIEALSPEYDSEPAWEAVSQLRRLGTREIFDRASQLCQAEHPLERARGADVLGQLGRTVEHPQNNFPDESFAILSRLVELETDPVPLSSGLVALGHLGDRRAVPIITKFTSNTDREVRFSVAFALSSFAKESAAIAVLMQLMEDPDEKVRDWATFGLGVLGTEDTDQIRDSLFRRLSDRDEDTREEALVGLAKRRDNRALHPLVEAFLKPEVGPRMVEAANFILGNVQETDWSNEEYLAALRRLI